MKIFVNCMDQNFVSVFPPDQPLRLDALCDLYRKKRQIEEAFSALSQLRPVVILLDPGRVKREDAITWADEFSPP